jgi:hypothetical protein
VKLDPVKVAWIITQKETGATNSEIARAMNVSERRVQSLWSDYKATGEVPALKRPGRRRVEGSDEERRIIEEAYARYEVNALTLERAIEVDKMARDAQLGRARDALRSLTDRLQRPARAFPRRLWGLRDQGLCAGGLA